MATLPRPITTEADVHAWRALMNGSATPDQQIRCVNWLALASGRAGVAYVPGPDGDRDTLVLIGQQRLGVFIGNMSTPAALDQAMADDRERANPRPFSETSPRRAPRRINRDKS